MVPSVLWTVEEIYSAFAACGLSLDRAVEVYRIIWQFMIGELTSSIAQESRAPAHDREPYRESVPASVDTGRFPTLARVGIAVLQGGEEVNGLSRIRGIELISSRV